MNRRLVRTCWSPVILACALSGVRAAEPESPPEIPVVRTVPAIDGEVEDAWQKGRRFELDYETRPAENTEPPVRTVAWILQSADTLYVAFRAFDPEPDSIRARYTDRDQAWDDDSVGITLDTFNGARRGYQFFVNPLGVQSDLFIDDLSGREDTSFDAIWASAGRLTDFGYEVEIAIPLKSLRFPQTDGGMTWGLDLLRFRPREYRRRIALQPRDRSISCYLCQISEMGGIRGEAANATQLELRPILVARNTRMKDPDTGAWEEHQSVEPGLDLLWGITPDHTLAATLNPDFSQVEADAARLDINRTFALFFEERRPFFLEGADFFNTPFRAVHTRSVADPDWGVKVTGKEGGHAYGVFAADDQSPGLLLPGSQGSAVTTLEDASRNAVGRYRYDVRDNSAVGMLAANRETEDYRNRVLGADATLRFSDADVLRLQGLRSETEYSAGVVNEFDQPAGAFSDTAVRLDFNHDERNWFASTHYSDVGPGFRADLGFMPRVDYRKALVGGGYRWWQNGGLWRRIQLSGDVDRTIEKSTGQELEREAELKLEVQAARQSFARVGGGTRRQWFEGRSFRQDFGHAGFETRPVRDIKFGVWSSFGDAIDFANVRPAERLNVSPHINTRLGRHVEFRLNHSHERLDVDQGRLFTADVTDLRVVYQFGLRSFLRLITQYSRIDRTPSLYNDPVDSESRDWGNQLLYSYKLNPRTVFFAGYSNALESANRNPLGTQQATFFVKFSYAWQP